MKLVQYLLILMMISFVLAGQPIGPEYHIDLSGDDIHVTEDGDDDDDDDGGSGGGGGGGSTYRRSTGECIPDWSCSEWSRCFEAGIQYRECIDNNGCNTDRPDVTRECEYIEETKKEEPEESPILEEKPTIEEPVIEEELPEKTEEIIKKLGTGVKLTMAVMVGLCTVMVVCDYNKRREEKNAEEKER